MAVLHGAFLPTADILYKARLASERLNYLSARFIVQKPLKGPHESV